MKKQLHQDVYIGFFCFALCLLIFALNVNLPADAVMMPRLLGGMLGGLSALIVYRGLQKSKQPAEKQGAKALTIDALRMPLITWGLIVLYFALFVVVGYFLSTGVMIAVLMRFMKRKSWPAIIGIDSVYLLLIYFLFARMLRVPIDGFGMLGQLL